jgi:hypothetical protein
MTELKKKSERDPLDRYYTPPALADACLRWTWARVQAEAYPGADVAPQRVAEPCAGAGAFGRAAATLWPGAEVSGCDVDPEADPGFACDRVPVSKWKPSGWYGHRLWIVTNPFYEGVYETIRTLRGMQRDTGADLLGLLLRSTTLERVMAGQTDPPDWIAITGQRPRWGGPGGEALRAGDTCGSVWCVWHSRVLRTMLSRGPERGETRIWGLPQWRAVGRAQIPGGAEVPRG